MKIKMALAAGAVAMAVSGAANAQIIQGFYLGAGAGVNWLTDVDGSGTGVSPDGNWNMRTGFGVTGALGYGLSFGSIGGRIELEGSYRQNSLKDIDGSAPIQRGQVRQTGIFANAAYDIDTGTPYFPFVGVGAGAVRYDVGTIQAPGGTIIDDGAWTWGVQGFAGVNARLAPGVFAGLKYNFMHTGAARNLTTMNCGGCDPLDLDPNNHSVLATLTLAIGPAPLPPAPPAPAAAPAVQRNFLVFFDFDKSDITAEADRVIVQAANNAKGASVTRITLTGHTDRSGPVAYNQRLSERRADAVKARLVREGIPANQIVTIGRGESQPLVPTADGVREPQNRRVEIVL